MTAKGFRFRYPRLFEPVIRALNDLGGSASIDELVQRVSSILKPSAEDLDRPHGESNLTEFEYQMAWARTYLKKAGYVENSKRGIWSLTEKGRTASKVVPSDIERIAKATFAPKASEDNTSEDLELATAAAEALEPWKDELLRVVRDMKPAAFERLCMRLLRESGFSQVEVTGRPGDGGVDGKGVIQLSGFVSFPVIFQCKRYKGSVAPEEVRGFRGSMEGRADRGLIITTGRFTENAKREAVRDGARPIDLVDGDLLAMKLKELRLGVQSEQIERVTVDATWFAGI
jgi:restriction system protein